MFINPAGDKGIKRNEEEKITSKKSKKRNRTYKTETSKFSEIFLEKKRELTEKELRELIDSILQAGNDFIRDRTEENLRRYKEAIKRFLNRIEKNLYELQTLGIEIDPHNYFKIARKINENLDRLTKNIIEKEKSTLNVVSKIEEINGLILDIYR